MNRVPAIALAAALAPPLAPTAAVAQDGWSWSIIIPSVTGTDILGQTLRQQTEPGRPAAIHAVQAQSRRAMLTLPSLLSAPDADKQAFAEGLLVQTGILGTVQEQLASNPAELRRLADGVRQGARAQAGLDLGAMRLTEAEFTRGG